MLWEPGPLWNTWSLPLWAAWIEIPLYREYKANWYVAAFMGGVD